MKRWLLLLLLTLPLFALGQTPTSPVGPKQNQSYLDNVGALWFFVNNTWFPLGAGFNNPMTTAGDIITGGASGIPTRLGIGAANTMLSVNLAGTGLEYRNVSATAGIAGSYASGLISLVLNENVIQATDANVPPINAGRLYKLPTITANRTIDISNPSSFTGKKVNFWNQNTSGFTWAFTGATIVSPAGVDASLIPSNSFVSIESDGTQWVATVSPSAAYTFSNGLTNTSGTVGLGGALIQSTTIDPSGHPLQLSSSTSGSFFGLGFSDASDNSQSNLYQFSDQTLISNTDQSGKTDVLIQLDGITGNPGSQLQIAADALTSTTPTQGSITFRSFTSGKQSIEQLINNASGGNKDILMSNVTANTGIVIDDSIDHMGLVASANIDTTKMGTNLQEYTTSKWVLGRIKNYGGGVGSGTVTNIATSTGITGGPITTTGTLKADTTVLQTVLNFFPKGDTRYAKISQLPAGANPSASIGFAAVNGSASSFTRSDGAPKADSTVIRSVANSYSLSGAQTKILTETHKENSKNIIQLYANRFYANTTDFTATGFSPSASAGVIALTSGSTTYSKYLTINNHINTNENFKFQVGYVVGSIAAGDGPSIGHTSTLAIGTGGGFAAKFDVSTGIIAITDGLSGGTTWATKQTSVTGTAVGDNIILTFSQSVTNLVIQIEDVSNGKTDYINYIAQGPSSLGTFVIYNFQGTMSIQNVSIVLNESYQPDVICIGDSKTTGATSGGNAAGTLFGDLKNRWVNLITNSGTVLVYASGGAETGDIVSALPDLLSSFEVKGKRVILNIGRNDVAFSVPSATWQANYASIVSSLTTAGATVVHLLPIPEASLNQSALTTYINTTYSGSSRIDVTSGFNTGTMLFIDGIHPNVLGYNYIASQIIGSGFIPVSTTGTLIQLPRPPPSPIDINLVHISGVETIQGIKTFSTDITVNGLTIGKGTGSASEATALGASALLATNTGSFNTAVGSQALKSNTSGGANTAVGRGALLTNTTAVNSTAIGTNALFNSNGGDNTAIGFTSLFTNSSGTGNTSVGKFALEFSTTSQNTAIGALALQNLSSGSLMTGIGYQALNTSTTASNSVGIGYNAGFGGNPSNSVFIGHNSGFTGAGTGSIFIGESSGFFETGSGKFYVSNTQNVPFIQGDITNNNLNFIPMLAPSTPLAISTSTTGGTFAAGTYFYVITATDGTGETVRSAELTQVTTGTTSTITVSWGSVVGAVNYKVYRGTTTGVENKLVATIAVPTLTFTDTNVAGSTASPLTSTTAFYDRMLANGGISLVGPLSLSSLTASQQVFTDASKNLVSSTLLTPSAIVSSAGTLAITEGNDYVFTGTTTTWTYQAISATHTGRAYQVTIKNRGVGNITLNSNAGANDFYDTTAINVLVITPGSAITLMPDGVFANRE